MLDTDTYDGVYALFTRLADRSGELTDEQHLAVMEAFDCFADLAYHGPPAVVAAAGTEPVADLLRLTAEGLARLSDDAPDGVTALALSRAYAILVSYLDA